MQSVFINVEKCVGCRHCEISCAIEHSQDRNLFSILRDDPQSQPRINVGLGIDFLTFPNKCRHCDPSPCQQICPTGAIYRDADTESVLIEVTKCISCGMCAMVCPFSTISFYKVSNLNKSTAYKCDNCISRQNKGEEPACVDACKTGALIFGDINESVAYSRHEVVMKVTKDIKGVDTSTIPENIKIFNELREKLASLGPMPSSKD
ncbi:anaerobic carbon-monoxide dehydrogenase iron sulfur subunit [Candidatus Magnetomoraceae bacterium gMMP-15]